MPALSVGQRWCRHCALRSIFQKRCRLRSPSLRRGDKVPGAAVARVAGEASVRARLWSLLKPLGASDLIPPKWRTRDAFAEADLVEWLSHPSELGHPPDKIEKMAVFTAKQKDEDVVLYVWRFRTGKDDWKAATSGLYPTRSPEGPLHGRETFSRFDPWSAHDAEGHAATALETLREWSRVKQ